MEAGTDMSSTTYRRKSDNTGLVALSGGLLGLALFVGITLFNGWVLSILWNWFIPSIFEGMPSLTVGYAIAISVVISALTSTQVKAKDDDEDAWVTMIKAVVTPIVKGFILLLMGFIVYAIAF